MKLKNFENFNTIEDEASEETQEQLSRNVKLSELGSMAVKLGANWKVKYSNMNEWQQLGVFKENPIDDLLYDENKNLDSIQLEIKKI